MLSTFKYRKYSSYVSYEVLFRSDLDVSLTEARYFCKAWLYLSHYISSFLICEEMKSQWVFLM